MRKFRGAGKTLLANGMISRSPVLVHCGVCAEGVLAADNAKNKLRRVRKVRFFLIPLSPFALAVTAKRIVSVGPCMSHSFTSLTLREIDVLSEVAIHDEGVDVAECRMVKGSREAANNRESKALPQERGSFIRADHKVELHGAETEPARFA